MSPNKLDIHYNGRLSIARDICAICDAASNSSYSKYQKIFFLLTTIILAGFQKLPFARRIIWNENRLWNIWILMNFAFENTRHFAIVWIRYQIFKSSLLCACGLNITHESGIFWWIRCWCSVRFIVSSLLPFSHSLFAFYFSFFRNELSFFPLFFHVRSQKK